MGVGIMSCSRDAKPQDGPLPCRAFIIFATLVGIAWVLLFWRKPVRINAIGINPRPSVQNRGGAGSATMRGMRGQDPEGEYKSEWKEMPCYRDAKPQDGQSTAARHPTRRTQMKKSSLDFSEVGRCGAKTRGVEINRSPRTKPRTADA